MALTKAQALNELAKQENWRTMSNEELVDGLLARQKKELLKQIEKMSELDGLNEGEKAHVRSIIYAIKTTKEDK